MFEGQVTCAKEPIDKILGDADKLFVGVGSDVPPISKVPTVWIYNRDAGTVTFCFKGINAFELYDMRCASPFQLPK